MQGQSTQLGLLNQIQQALLGVEAIISTDLNIQVLVDSTVASIQIVELQYCEYLFC